ncbi:hypothetical protein IV203_028518 [Nitzschia inconspicua]|uniref:Uncharacterized protein n=1 Tax=Nitzschia inconspicua TaxID=303405 RepID=A0A9K3PZS2_9STRA|nr:hypothetical protein IV203_028518 [Nitzschia inconspicua]
MTAAEDAKQQRQDMIDMELTSILDAARDFCLEHYEDDMEEEAIEAIKSAAKSLAYRKKYFDVMKDTFVYFPSCQALILSRDLIDEAQNNYYEAEDEFPAEYAKALRTVVFDKQKKEDDAKNGEGGLNDEEFMEKLAMEWHEAL